QPEQGQSECDQVEVAEGALDGVLEGEPEHDDGHRPDGDPPAEPGVGVTAGPQATAPSVSRAQGAPPREDDPRDVPAEVHQHRELGPDLTDRGEGGPGVTPA